MKSAKTIAIVLIAVIIISSLVLVYSKNWLQTNLPSLNKTTTTVNNMNLVLEIYGNANMDDKIDSDDVAYLQQIINGSAAKTQFADANKDGIIDEKDIAQINAIITGKATKLYMIDGSKTDITVSLPANRIIIEYNQNAELVKILGVEHLVVGIDSGIEHVKNIFFPNNADSITSVGSMSSPDYERILNLNPTTLLVFSPGSGGSATTNDKATHLPGIDVIYLGLYTPNVTNPQDSSFIQGILKAGYIFNKIPQATEYANWILTITTNIHTKINTIPINQRHTVLLTNSPAIGSPKAYVALDTLGQACILAGGNNIANVPAGSTAFSIALDIEYIISKNPDYIFLHTVRYTYGGIINEPPQGTDTNDTTGMKNVLQQYVTQPAFANLDAVKNNTVYMIAGDFRNNAMGGTLCAVYMAKILYPEVFTDLNPQEIHQEYITRFLQLNYNLDTNGVFLYPAITVNGDTVGIPNGAN
ncbi:MAG: ABC transporter substrate-binding protein [Nitrososphaerota archaeon]|jgi:iron complex transport system substrate-binding protein|nr:ABC transporter substrate-binding protein [Nitrososphaerota archaeon]